MKHASRTNKIQYSMERINVNPVYIFPAPAYCFERQSRNKPALPRQIHSIRLVLYNRLGNIHDVYLGERTIYSPHSIAGNNRFLSTNKMELVKVCHIRFICINNSVFCNDIKNSNNANSSSNRSWLYRKPNGRGILQLSNSWILRGLHLGHYSSNINIQRLMADSPSIIKSRCEAKYRILFGRDVNRNLNQLNRLWNINSWICNSPHSCLSRKHPSLHLGICLYVYPSNAICDNRLILSDNSYNSQCIIQSGLCNRSLDRRSIDRFNFYKNKRAEAMA